MLQNLIKCNTYILIDVEYLNTKIEEGYNFYRNLYPKKLFKDFEMIDLLEAISTTCRIDYTTNTANVILFHKLGSTIAHSANSQRVVSYGVYPNPRTITQPSGYTMNIYSFYADPFSDDSATYEPISDYDKEFLNYIREIASKPDVSNVVICKDIDNDFTLDIYNQLFEKIDATSDPDRKFFLIKNLDSDSLLGPVKSTRFFSAVLDYLIAICMGLEEKDW